MKSYGGYVDKTMVRPVRQPARKSIAAKNIPFQASIEIVTDRGISFVLHRANNGTPAAFYMTYADSPEAVMMSERSDDRHANLYERYTVEGGAFTEGAEMNLRLMSGPTEKHKIERYTLRNALYKVPKWKAAGKRGIGRSGRPPQ